MIQLDIFLYSRGVFLPLSIEFPKLPSWNRLLGLVSVFKVDVKRLVKDGGILVGLTLLVMSFFGLTLGSMLLGNLILLLLDPPL